MAKFVIGKRSHSIRPVKYNPMLFLFWLFVSLSIFKCMPVVQPQPPPHNPPQHHHHYYYYPPGQQQFQYDYRYQAPGQPWPPPLEIDAAGQVHFAQEVVQLQAGIPQQQPPYQQPQQPQQAGQIYVQPQQQFVPLQQGIHQPQNQPHSPGFQQQAGQQQPLHLQGPAAQQLAIPYPQNVVPLQPGFHQQQQLPPHPSPQQQAIQQVQHWQQQQHQHHQQGMIGRPQRVESAPALFHPPPQQLLPQNQQILFEPLTPYVQQPVAIIPPAISPQQQQNLPPMQQASPLLLDYADLDDLVPLESGFHQQHYQFPPHSSPQQQAIQQIQENQPGIAQQAMNQPFRTPPSLQNKMQQIYQQHQQGIHHSTSPIGTPTSVAAAATAASPRGALQTPPTTGRVRSRSRSSSRPASVHSTTSSAAEAALNQRQPQGSRRARKYTLNADQQELMFDFYGRVEPDFVAASDEFRQRGPPARGQPWPETLMRGFAALYRHAGVTSSFLAERHNRHGQSSLIEHELNAWGEPLFADDEGGGGSATLTGARATNLASDRLERYFLRRDIRVGTPSPVRGNAMRTVPVYSDDSDDDQQQQTRARLILRIPRIQNTMQQPQQLKQTPVHQRQQIQIQPKAGPSHQQTLPKAGPSYQQIQLNAGPSHQQTLQQVQHQLQKRSHQKQKQLTPRENELNILITRQPPANRRHRKYKLSRQQQTELFQQYALHDRDFQRASDELKKMKKRERVHEFSEDLMRGLHALYRHAGLSSNFLAEHHNKRNLYSKLEYELDIRGEPLYAAQQGKRKSEAIALETAKQGLQRHLESRQRGESPLPSRGPSPINQRKKLRQYADESDTGGNVIAPKIGSRKNLQGKQQPQGSSPRSSSSPVGTPTRSPSPKRRRPGSPRRSRSRSPPMLGVSKRRKRSVQRG